MLRSTRLRAGVGERWVTRGTGREGEGRVGRDQSGQLCPSRRVCRWCEQRCDPGCACGPAWRWAYGTPSRRCVFNTSDASYGGEPGDACRGQGAPLMGYPKGRAAVSLLQRGKSADAF